MASTIRSRIETMPENCKDEFFAFQTFCNDTALATADYLNAMRSDGANLEPFHGTAIRVKDTIDVPEVPTRAGAAVRANQPPAARDWLIAASLESLILTPTVTYRTVGKSGGGAKSSPQTLRRPWGWGSGRLGKS